MSDGSRNQSGNMGGGPRVQTDATPKDGPLGNIIKDTAIVEPVILRGGKARGPSES